MPIVDLTPFDITTAKPRADGSTALTVPGHRICEVSEFARYEDDCAVLWAPTSGATTASVNRTRCEIKGKPFFILEGRDHIAQMTAQVTQVNWKGSFVLLQAHCHDGKDPTLKCFIETQNGRTAVFKVGLRTEAGSESPPRQVVFEQIDLAEPFTARIRLLRSGKVEVKFEQGKRRETLLGQLSTERRNRPHVFHWGVYNQVDQGHSCEPPSDGTLLKLLKIVELHNPLGS